MNANAIKDLSRCAVHTITNKPWTLAQCCEHYARAGIGGISIWRDVVVPEERGVGLAEAVRIVQGTDLAVPAYVRGGFFPATENVEPAPAPSLHDGRDPFAN